MKVTRTRDGLPPRLPFDWHAGIYRMKADDGRIFWVGRTGDRNGWSGRSSIRWIAFTPEGVRVNSAKKLAWLKKYLSGEWTRTFGEVAR